MSRIPIVGDNFDFFISDAVSEINLFCCDCGLAHNFRFKKESDGIWMRVSARPKKTAQKRRHGNVAMMNGENEQWEMRRRRRGPQRKN